MPTPSKTVIVTGETASVRDRFAAALEGAGHATVDIGTASELLAFLRGRQVRVDLLLLDLRLAATPGVDLVRSIQDLGTERLPILVFSGSVASATEARALATLGIAGYVNEHSAAQQVVPALVPYLFPDSFDRRTSPRVVLNIPVSFQCGDTVAAAFTLNVGNGGLGIRTMTPLAVNAKVQVRFRLPGTDRDITAGARVAWTDHRLGMGLQFEQVDPTDQLALDEFIDRHRAARHGAASPPAITPRR